MAIVDPARGMSDLRFEFGPIRDRNFEAVAAYGKTFEMKSQPLYGSATD
jgi:hypothetical protein